MYFCCEEHVELALDMVVDESEAAPVMEKLQEDEQISTGCSFCDSHAIYKISG